MAGEISIHQLFQTPTITRVVSRIKTPLSLFQQWLGQMPGQGATESVSGRHVGWDIFARTRLMAKGRAPGTGPATAAPRRVGHVSSVAYRAHEKIHISQEQVFRTRPLGMQHGTVDVRGQNYINRQVEFLTQRFRNNREFMVSRMFRGGFGVAMSGEDWVPVEKGAADAVFDVDMQMNANNLNQLDMGTGSDIISANWHTASTDVIANVLAVNKAFERLNGRALRHCWINSTLFRSLLDNTDMQTIGGSAYRVFESLSARNVSSSDGIPDTGYDVVFRSLPLQTFHVYDGVLATGDLAPGSAETTTANTTEFLGDDDIILAPEPDNTWQGWIEGSEVVAENVLDTGREVFGFHNWTTRVIDPAGWELKMLDNGLPALYVPDAVAFGNVTP